MQINIGLRFSYLEKYLFLQLTSIIYLKAIRERSHITSSAEGGEGVSKR